MSYIFIRVRKEQANTFGISTGSLIGQNTLAKTLRNRLIVEANSKGISINDTKRVWNVASTFKGSSLPLSTRTIHKVLSSLEERTKIFRITAGRITNKSVRKQIGAYGRIDAKVKLGRKVRLAAAWIRYILTRKINMSITELLGLVDQGEKPP